MTVVSTGINTQTLEPRGIKKKARMKTGWGSASALEGPCVALPATSRWNFAPNG